MEASQESLDLEPPGGYRPKINLAAAHNYQGEYEKAYGLYKEAEQTPPKGDPDSIRLEVISKKSIN